MNYYKRLGISEKEIMPKTASFYLLFVAMLIVLVGSILYSVFVAPIFKPLPIIIFIVLMGLIWRYFTRHIADIRVLKLERIKLITSIIAVFLLFFIGL